MVLNDPTLPADHPINKIDGWEDLKRTGDGGKFAPKLTKAIKCEILALYHRELPIPLLAAAFGVHRRTVGQIVGELSAKYKDIRALRDGMGGKAFDTHYITEEGVAKCLAAKADPATYVSTRKYHQEKAGAQPNAKRHAGRHIIAPSELGYLKEHTIDVFFAKEVVLPDYNGGKPFSAWGFFVISSDYPDTFNCTYAVSPTETKHFLSSTEAYSHAVNGGINV